MFFPDEREDDTRWDPADDDDEDEDLLHWDAAAYNVSGSIHHIDDIC